MTYDPNQPRVKSGNVNGGQWTATGVNKATRAARKGANVTPETGAKLYAKLAAGGFTESLAGESPKTGYMTAFSSETEHSAPVSEISQLDILEYMEAHFAELATAGNYFGGWVDDDENGVPTVYLDVSQNIESLDEAMKVARESDQIAIWDLSSNDSLYVDEYFEKKD